MLTTEQAWTIWQARSLGYISFVFCHVLYLGFPLYMLIIEHRVCPWGFWAWGIGTSLCTWWQLWVHKICKKILKEAKWI